MFAAMPVTVGVISFTVQVLLLFKFSGFLVFLLMLPFTLCLEVWHKLIFITFQKLKQKTCVICTFYIYNIFFFRHQHTCQPIQFSSIK